MAKRPTVPQPKPITGKLIEAQRKAEEQEHAPKVLSEVQAEVSSEAAPLWDFVQNNARLIALAVVAVLILVLAFGVFQWNRDRAISNAQAELGAITALSDPAQRLSRLEAFAPEAPKAIKIAVYLEMGLAAGQSENWQAAEQAYSAILALEGETPLALVVRLNRSDALLALGRPEQALEDLEYVKARTQDQTVLRGLEELIAEAAEQAGQNERAIAAFQNSLSMLNPSSQEDLELQNYYNWRISRLQTN